MAPAKAGLEFLQNVGARISCSILRGQLFALALQGHGQRGAPGPPAFCPSALRLLAILAPTAKSDPPFAISMVSMLSSRDPCVFDVPVLRLRAILAMHSTHTLPFLPPALATPCSTVWL